MKALPHAVLATWPSPGASPTTRRCSRVSTKSLPRFFHEKFCRKERKEHKGNVGATGGRPLFCSFILAMSTTIDSPAVELAPIREVLRLYCQALSERSIDLQDLKQLIDKNIGWSKNDVATSDGVAIFLPGTIEQFEARSENYDFL